MTRICFVDISSSWVEISLHTKFQLPRLPGSRTAIFRLNPIGVGGGGDPFFIFLLVGLKEGCMPNFSFLACLEVEVLWLETTNKNKKDKTRLGRIRGYLSLS